MDLGEHTNDFNCPICGCKKALGLKIIDSPTPIRDSSPCNGVVIKECINCYHKFWHHVLKEICIIKPKTYNIIGFIKS